MRKWLCGARIQTVLLVAVVSLGAACKGSEDNPKAPDGVVRVLAEREITTTGNAQTILLANAENGAEDVLIRVPASAVPPGTVVRARIVAVNPQIRRAPVRAQAIDVQPASLVFQRPVVARRRIPAQQPSPGVRRRRVAVQLDSQSEEGTVFRARQPARRVGLPKPEAPATTEWEYDISGGGVWGLGEVEEAANAPLPGGGTLLDEVEIPFGDEAQTVYLGSAPNWFALLIPPAPEAPDAVPVRPGTAAQVARRVPAPVTIQAVSMVPARMGPAPFAGTVFRVPAPVTSANPALIIRRPRFQVHVPVPPLQEGYSVTRVSSADESDTWMAEEASTVPRVPSPVEPAPAGVVYHDLSIEPEAVGYIGVAEVAPRPPPPPAPAELSASTATLNFGGVAVGQSSAAQPVTLTNTGEQASGAVQAALQGAQAGAFSIASNTCGESIAAGASCILGVEFAPEAAGALAATLAVSASPGGVLQVGLSGRGQTPGSLVFDPTSHDFGGTAVGARSDGQTFVLRNPGDLPSGAVSIGLTGADQAAFEVASSTCSAALDAGAMCTVEVVFTPNAAGASSATLQASASPGGATTAALMGLGQSSASVVASAPSRAFGGVVLGQTSSASTVTISNAGDLTTGALSVSVIGDHPADFSVSQDTCDGETLDGGAACAVSVRFAPSAVGAREATLLVEGTPGGSQSITLSGSGLSEASVSVSPSTETFAERVIGETSATTTFVVRNGGDQTTGVPVVSLEGGTSGDFEIVTNGCNAVLAKDATCEVAVRFEPTASGNRTTTLQVVTTPGGTGTAALSGLGLEPAELTVSETLASFGSLPVGTASSLTELTISNVGEAATGALSVGVVGSNAFEIISDTCTSALAPDASCTVGVRFTPDAEGSFAGALEIAATPGGSLQVSLSGNGITPATLMVDAPTLQFGGVLIGASSNGSQVTLTNVGAVPSGAVTAAVTGTHASDFAVVSQCQSLSPDMGCTTAVVFTPSGAGARAATLSFSATPGGQQSVALSGTGLQAAQISTAIVGLNFGERQTGLTSGALAVQISNDGDVATGTPSVQLGGQNASAFNLTDNGCSTAIDGGDSCSITLSFSPEFDGEHTATLSVTTTPGGSVEIPLEGKGVPPALASLKVDTTPRAFGTWKFDETSTSTLITVENVGLTTTAPLDVSFSHDSFKVAGANNCQGATLAYNETCSFSVVFEHSQFESSTSVLGSVNVSNPGGGNRIVLFSGSAECITPNSQNAFTGGGFDDESDLSSWWSGAQKPIFSWVGNSDRHSCSDSGVLKAAFPPDPAGSSNNSFAVYSRCIPVPQGTSQFGFSIRTTRPLPAGKLFSTHAYFKDSICTEYHSDAVTGNMSHSDTGGLWSQTTPVSVQNSNQDPLYMHWWIWANNDTGTDTWEFELDAFYLAPEAGF